MRGVAIVVIVLLFAARAHVGSLPITVQHEAQPVAGAQAADPPWQAFVVAASADERVAREAMRTIAPLWRDGYTPMLIDLARLMPSSRAGNPADDDLTRRPTPGALARGRLIAFLQDRTKQRFGDDLAAWRRWMWSLPASPHADYAVFKGEVYARLDPAFREFFPPGVKHVIRLDQIDWGGVQVNGIPPLRSPKAIAAPAATWLRDNHVVFGIEVNGQARAYPKRILAWHELATDTLGGVPLTIVYCTLCGAAVPYESTVQGRRFTFGTSGLLYRSNKLMFDQETKSLWSSIEGTPAVGPLVSTGLRLVARPIVTTTWGEWRRDHPSTSVMSIDTGFARDYGEGVAYREYFATHRLMFEVPVPDTRLDNKTEVLVLRPAEAGPGMPPVAIAVDRLMRQPVFSFESGVRRFVVVTSRDGANRVYDRGDVTFVNREADGRVRDAGGHAWTATDAALVGRTGERLPRVAAHRAFWFGWVAQYPDTVLHR